MPIQSSQNLPGPRRTRGAQRVKPTTALSYMLRTPSRLDHLFGFKPCSLRVSNFLGLIIWTIHVHFGIRPGKSGLGLVGRKMLSNWLCLWQALRWEAVPRALVSRRWWKQESGLWENTSNFSRPLLFPCVASAGLGKSLQFRLPWVLFPGSRKDWGLEWERVEMTDSYRSSNKRPVNNSLLPRQDSALTTMVDWDLGHHGRLPTSLWWREPSSERGIFWYISKECQRIFLEKHRLFV